MLYGTPETNMLKRKYPADQFSMMHVLLFMALAIPLTTGLVFTKVSDFVTTQLLSEPSGYKTNLLKRKYPVDHFSMIHVLSFMALIIPLTAGLVFTKVFDFVTTQLLSEPSGYKHNPSETDPTSTKQSSGLNERSSKLSPDGESEHVPTEAEKKLGDDDDDDTSDSFILPPVLGRSDPPSPFGSSGRSRNWRSRGQLEIITDTLLEEVEEKGGTGGAGNNAEMRAQSRKATFSPPHIPRVVDQLMGRSPPSSNQEGSCNSTATITDDHDEDNQDGGGCYTPRQNRDSHQASPQHTPPPTALAVKKAKRGIHRRYSSSAFVTPPPKGATRASGSGGGGGALRRSLPGSDPVFRRRASLPSAASPLSPSLIGGVAMLLGGGVLASPGRGGGGGGGGRG